jgi:hypothetical protein
MNRNTFIGACVGMISLASVITVDRLETNPTGTTSKPCVIMYGNSDTGALLPVGSTYSTYKGYGAWSVNGSVYGYSAYEDSTIFQTIDCVGA